MSNKGSICPRQNWVRKGEQACQCNAIMSRTSFRRILCTGGDSYSASRSLLRASFSTLSCFLRVSHSCFIWFFLSALAVVANIFCTRCLFLGPLFFFALGLYHFPHETIYIHQLLPEPLSDLYHRGLVQSHETPSAFLFLRWFSSRDNMSF